LNTYNDSKHHELSMSKKDALSGTSTELWTEALLGNSAGNLSSSRERKGSTLDGTNFGTFQM
jgi:hypothetical protein